MKSAHMIYFVLYLIVITEILLVIIERDEAQDKLKYSSVNMLSDISNNYKQDIFFSIPNKISNYSLKNDTLKTIVISPIGLFSKSEKESSELIIEPIVNKNELKEWSKKNQNFIPISSKDTSKNNFFFITKEKNGDFHFKTKFKSTGNYKFLVKHKFVPNLPKYLLPEQKDSVKLWLSGNNIKNINRIKFDSTVVGPIDTILISVNKGKEIRIDDLNIVN